MAVGVPPSTGCGYYRPAFMVAGALRPGDVLLIEGNTRISAAIKYLTQSTWSHAALFVGDALGPLAPGEEPATLIEADMRDGVRAIPLNRCMYKASSPIGAWLLIALAQGWS